MLSIDVKSICVYRNLFSSNLKFESNNFSKLSGLAIQWLLHNICIE